MSAATERAEPGLQARLDQLAWYVNRLRAMNGTEVAHRVREAAKRRLSRFYASGWAAFDLGDGAVPCLPPQAGALEALAPGLAGAWRKAAAAAKRGDVTLLGQTWPAEQGAARWHRDPVTGGSWPAQTYCFDVGYRHEKTLGDVKYVWELNRLQHLQPVAALAAAEGDEALATFCLAEIESWIDANPPFKGVNWASGIELALRIVSILVVLGLIGPERASPEQRRKIRSCLAAHAYWLSRYPSRHSSANNHLIAEAGALFLLGTAWPELGIAERAEEGRETLIAEVYRQFHCDGVGAEQSPTYAAFTLEWYLLCAHTAHQAGVPFPKAVCKRVGEAGKFLRWIMDEGGNVPRIGDDDEGRVLAGKPEGNDYVASVLGAISATLRRPDLAPRRVAPSLRNLYFGLPQPCLKGPKGARLFSSGGYSVFRRHIAGRKAMMVMDHGPLGHLSIAAHGHADALALWLHLGDQPVLVDAGTYLYHSGGPWRDRLRGTGVHNTLCLAGEDSSRIAGAFNWSKKARCQRIAWQSNAQEATARVRHDGYLAAHGLYHERRLVAHAQGFTVRDTLMSDKHRPLPLPPAEISFLVHPDLDVTLDGATATILRAGEPLLRISGCAGLDLELHRGESNPARGWYSDRFGAIRPAPQLVFHARKGGTRQFEIELEIVAPDPARRRKRAAKETLADTSAVAQ